MKLKDVKLTKDRLRHLNRSIKKYIIPLEERNPVITENDVWERIRDTHTEQLQAELRRVEQEASLARQERAQRRAIAYEAQRPSFDISDTDRRNWTHRQEEARRLSIEPPTIDYAGYQTTAETNHDAHLRQQILDLDQLVNMSDDYQEIAVANGRRDTLYHELVSFRQTQQGRS